MEDSGILYQIKSCLRVYKEHCWTIYEKVCKGYGYHKKCFPVPKQRCKQIPVKVGIKVRREWHSRQRDSSQQIFHPIFQIPKTKCKSVPTKKCTDAPVYVPKKECKHFPKTVCLKDPVQVERAMMTQFLFPNPIFLISDCP